MRKVDNSTSQDGADTTSITSIFESEGKKSTTGLKTKRNSIKRKITNFSHDSDDTVIEPLLQPEKDKCDKSKSAKFSMSKSKSDLTSEAPNILSESHLDHITETSSSCFLKNIPNFNPVQDISVMNTSATVPIYNQMNTNIFEGLDTTKPIQTKSAVIVEIDNTKCPSYNPSPLIFTTAKIHADNKAKQLEPFQTTPVPILSTIEGTIKSKPSIIDSTDKDFGYTNSKSDTKTIKNLENDDKVNKTTNFNDKESTKSVTLTRDPKDKSAIICKENTFTTTTISPVQSTSKTSFDKSFKMADINITDKKNSTVDLKLSTVTKSDKTLQQQEKSHGLAADNTKINVTEKVAGDSVQFISQKNIGKFNKVEKVLPIDQNKKQTFEGISFPKPCLMSNKESIETPTTSTDVTNKEKSSKSATNVPSNRQLQRQKNATVEDITDLDIKNKNNDCSKTEGSNLLKDQNTTIKMYTKHSSRIESDNKATNVVEKPKIPSENDNVTTTLIKPINTISTSRTDKASLVTEVPMKKPKTFDTSAKSSAPKTKSIESSKDYSKPNISAAESDILKAKNMTSDKETVLDTKTVSKQSAVVGSSQLSDNVGSIQNMKSSSSIKSDASSTGKPKVSNNTTLPSIGTKTVNQNLGNKTPITTTSSTTNILKDSGIRNLPSTSAKTMITANKKIEPLYSKHNKDSRA